MMRSGRAKSAEEFIRPYLDRVGSSEFDVQEDRFDGESLFRMRICMAGALRHQERHREAAEFYRLALRESRLPERHPDLPDAQSGLAAVLLQLGETEGAVSFAWQAYQLQRHWQGMSNSATVNALRLSAWASAKNGSLSDAEARLTLLEQTVRDVYAPGGPAAALNGMLWADLRDRQGQNDAAVELYRKWNELAAKGMTKNHWFRREFARLRDRLAQ